MCNRWCFWHGQWYWHGWSVFDGKRWGASNTTNTSKTTIINKTDVDQKFENNIKELLGVGNISTSSVSSSNVDITIIIGKDYK